MISITSKSSRIVIMVLFLLGILLLQAYPASAANPLADGEYTIDFEILKGDPKDDSTSLANGYWNKPATVIVKNGEMTVQTVINKNEWVVEFATQQGGRFVDAKVVSSNKEKDTRVVEFKLGSMDTDLVTTMTVDIPSQNYYHSYETRFRFYADTLKLVKAAEPAATQAPAKQAATTESSSSKDAESASSSTANTAASGKEQTSKPSKPASESSSASAGKGGGISGNSGNTSNGSASSSAASKGNADASESSSSSATSSNAAQEVQADDASASASTESADAEEKEREAPVAGVGDGDQEAEQLNDDEGVMTKEQSSEEVDSDLYAVLNDPASEAGGTIDEESKQGGASSFIIILIIGVLFIAGSIAWMIFNKRKKA